MKHTHYPAHHWAHHVGKWLFAQASHFWIILAFVTIGLLLFTSITFNFLLGVEQGADASSHFLLPRAYAGLDVAATVCFCILGYASGHRLRKMLAFGWALFLIVLSLWAAFSYTLMTDEIKRRDSQGTQAVIAQAEADIASWQRQIATWEDKLAHTQKYHSLFQQRIDEVATRKAGAEARLHMLQQANYPPPLTINYKVSALLSGVVSPEWVSPEKIGTLVRLLFSAAITLTPTLLMVVLAGMLYARTRLRVEGESPSPTPLRRIRGGVTQQMGGVRTRLLSMLRGYLPARRTSSGISLPPTSSGTEVQTKAPENQASQRVATGGVSLTKPATGSNLVSTSSGTTRPPSKQQKQGQHTPKQGGRRKSAKRVEAGHQKDTGTHGLAGNRYDFIREQVQAGKIKPTIKAIREAGGCNQKVATRYRNQLLAAHIIRPKAKGCGYELTPPEKSKTSGGKTGGGKTGGEVVTLPKPSLAAHHMR